MPVTGGKTFLTYRNGAFRKVHVFNNTELFKVDTAITGAEVIAIAGGGGGGNNGGGGGGAGGVVSTTMDFPVGTYEVLVGGGGRGSVSGNVASNGKDTKFGDATDFLVKGDNGTGNPPVDVSNSPLTVISAGSVIVNATQTKYGSGAVHFPSNGSYYSTAQDNKFRFDGDFTVETWVYITATPTGTAYSLWDCCPLSGSGSRSNAIYWCIDTNRQLQTFHNGSWQAISSQTVPLNEWVHLAITRENGLCRYFINGSVDPNTFTMNTNLSEGGNVIGTVANAPGTSGYNFIGWMDDFRITKGYARYGLNSFVPPGSLIAPSSITGPVAIGGGGGASRDGGGAPGVGGSGGAGSGGVNSTLSTGAAGTSGQGNAGGNGKIPDDGASNAGGGGGGYNSAGTNAVTVSSINYPGNGGIGFTTDITGKSEKFAGGGAGGLVVNGQWSTGNAGGGNGPDTHAVPNTGSGGGGGGAGTSVNGNGATGILIISYPAFEETVPSAKYRDLIITNSGSDVTDQQILLENILFPEAGLTGSWHFNEISGTKVFDSSGARNDGTINGGTRVDGKFGGGIRLTGTNENVRLVNSDIVTLLPRANYSYMFWYKPEGSISPSVSNPIYGRGVFADSNAPSGATHFGVWRANLSGVGDGLHCVHLDAGGTARIVSCTYTVDTWIHVAVTYSSTSGKFRIYKNGVLAQELSSITARYGEASFMNLGKSFRDDVGAAQGIYDEVRLFNRELTATEVLTFASADENNRSDYVGWNVFADEELTTPVPFWFQQDGKLWVKTSIGVTSTKTLYLAQGPLFGTLDLQDPDNTFVFFDGFKGRNIDLNKWEKRDPSRAIAQDDRLKDSSNNNNWAGGLIQKNPVDRTTKGKVAHFWKRNISGNYVMVGWKNNTGVQNEVYRDLIYADYHISDSHYVYSNASQLSFGPGPSVTTGKTYIHRVVALPGSGFEISQAGPYVYDTHNTWYTNAASNETNIKMAYAEYSQEFDMYAVWVTDYTTNTFTYTISEQREPATKLSHTITVPDISRLVSLSHQASVNYVSGMNYFVVWPKSTEYEAIGFDTISFKEGDFD